MILYHGTKQKFDKFSLDYIGQNARNEGPGIYLTDSKDVARSYAYDNGFVLTIEFNGKKPLSSKEITLSRNELKYLILSLHEEDNYLDNINDISYYGFERVLNEAIDMSLNDNDNDCDLISEIGNTLGSHKLVLDTLYYKLGYDHIVTKATWGYDLGQENIYVVFNPDVLNIIKSEDYK
ncbi:MAG: hypothetical protein IJ086_00850 [Clostridium sp.]|nr:hypothetical protein [Clostridium sp.]